MTLDALTTRSEHACFGGRQLFLEHASRVIGLPMRFSVYLPPQARERAVPALVYLAGLTCNEETFMTKAGAQRLASELGLALVAPDTSPRGDAVEQLPGAKADWDFGIGAGFYLDATEAPWQTHFRMESYLMDELLPGLPGAFAIDTDRLGIFGHSMGGHGALTLALRHPGRFRSLSAFAPICAPTHCPWGEKAFSRYLGNDRERWAEHDASLLMRTQESAPYPEGIRVDQGLADNFLAQQLHPDRFEAACQAAGQPLAMHRHAGYDHGYYFVQSFMAEHLRHHAAQLSPLPQSQQQQQQQQQSQSQSQSQAGG